MSSNNRLLSIYTCLKPRMYHNLQLYYLLATVPVTYRKNMKDKTQQTWKNVWLHLLFYFAIHGMDGYNWNCKLTQYLWKQGWFQVLVSKKHIALENTKPLQKAPQLIMVPLKFMAPSAPLKLHYTLNRNICQVHCTWARNGCKCSSKKHCTH